MGDGSNLNDMELGPNARFVNNSIPANARANENKIGGGREISGNSILGFTGNICDGDLIGNVDMYVAYNEIGKAAGVINCTFGGFGINNVKIGAGIAIANKTLSEGISYAVSELGASNIKSTNDISGLTTVDFSGEKTYVGIYNLTSSNASEALDTITNFPTQFQFTLKPAAGLTLTITGTPIGSIAPGGIVLKATDYTLDGSKGEYIILEGDPTGTYLVEKLVVNGLI